MEEGIRFCGSCGAPVMQGQQAPPTLPPPGRRGRTLYIVLILAVAAAAVVGAYAFLSLGGGTTYASYTNSTAGVTMSYPSGWSSVDQNVMAFSTPNQDAKVAVIDIGLANGVTAQEAANQGIVASRNAEPTFVLVSNTTTTVNGAAAPQFSFTFQYNGSVRQVTITVIGVCGHIYNVDYATFQSGEQTYLPMYQAMVNSLKFSCSG